MKHTSLVAGLALLALGSSFQVSQAAVLLTDNFNSENGGVGAYNYTGFANWKVTSGSVDLIGAGGPYDFYSGNGLYVDLNGSTGHPGQLTSDVIFAAGSYKLTFDLGGNARGDGSKTTSVSFGLGTFSKSLTLASSAGLDTYTYTFTTTKAGSLVFTDAAGGNPNIGNILDNVTVATAVPEMSTWMMMLAGFAGLGFVSFRKAKKTTAGLAIA
jgi:hypothetical protein